jgi:hypothetical protein
MEDRRTIEVWLFLPFEEASTLGVKHSQVGNDMEGAADKGCVSSRSFTLLVSEYELRAIATDSKSELS